MRYGIILSICGLLLAACGNSTEQRAATGALGGAVVGTAVGAPIAGAALGGTAGVATR
jgi:osmotically inducible lipoprotein OsmB